MWLSSDLPLPGVYRIRALCAEFLAAGRQFHERPFQRGQRGQLVQHDGLGRGELADPGRRQAGDREQPGALRRGTPDHLPARRRDQIGQPVRVGGAHPDRLVRAARDHVLGAGLGDELSPADDDQVVGGDGHLVLLTMNPKNWIGDKGYIGNNMVTPYRKPAGGELLDWQKEYNSQVNKIRWMIEQVISHFKNWTIVHTDYRRPLKTFETTISAVIGLHFYRAA